MPSRPVREGFHAVKFGWGPIGRGSVEDDADHFDAAREGLGPDGILLVDVGQIWGEDVEAAAARLPALEAAGAVWLEEPFNASALEAYGRSRAAARKRQDRRRGGRRTTSSWRGTSSTMAASASSRSIAAASAASGRRKRSPTTRSRAASPTSITLSRRTWP